MLAKDKICPVLVIAKGSWTSRHDVATDTKLTDILVDCQCLGNDCGWFRGKDIRDEQDQDAGICSVKDIPGWLANLHTLAKPKITTRPTEKK